MIPKRKFGNTGLEVSILGLGGGQIGDYNLPDKEVEKLLNFALDNGINLIDTARGYYASEERIGKFISHRRDEFVLSTKVGYGIQGFDDWTYDCIIAGVDAALKLMKTEIIDIVHLHSCNSDIMKNNGVIDALLTTVENGKVKAAAYTGENDDLEFAVNSGKFNSVQTSVNITDQRDLDKILIKAKQTGMGVIAKRPVANAPWRFTERPAGQYCEDYWLRWKKMNLDFGMDWQEVALRFTAFTEVVDSCIVGTANIEHLKENIKIIEKGKLPGENYNSIRESFKRNDDGWIGLL